jgi:hypothetical protein
MLSLLEGQKKEQEKQNQNPTRKLQTAFFKCDDNYKSSLSNTFFVSSGQQHHQLSNQRVLKKKSVSQMYNDHPEDTRINEYDIPSRRSGS